MQPPVPPSSPPEITGPAPAVVLDEPTRRRLAVTAFAMGVSTRQIEELLRILLAEDGPDEPTRRRLAVTAFAMGVSTRQIEELLRILLAEDGPDHSTIARWAADEAEEAGPVLEAVDAACIPEVRTLAIDEIFLGGDRPWSASSRRA